MSSRLPSQVIILAEDERHQRFATQYLQRMGVPRHALRLASLPAGKGCGEQWVRVQYAREVKTYRARAARAKSALMVVIDADADAVEKRAEQLKTELTQAGLSHRAAMEEIVHMIPKRNIETWILYLAGSDVDESSDYKQTHGIDFKLPDAVLKFFDHTRPNAVLPADCLPSLLKAIEEAKRLE